MLKKLLFYLKVSRPGLWFATIWLYLLPTSQMESVWSDPTFYYGLFFVCFPLNFLVYGWNDIVDQKTDALNPRKDSFWFGARGSADQLKILWKAILVVQIVTGPLLVYFGGMNSVYLFLAFVFINGLYNLPTYGLRSRPPLELICQVGYLLVAALSVAINDTAPLPWTTYLYLYLFSVQSHLMGEVMDIDPDRAAGRKTTATKIGRKKTKLLIIGIVMLEIALLFTVYEEYIFGGMLALGLIWLIIDLLFIFKSNNYTIGQMKLFALASNVVALASMMYVWHSECLLGG